jgi:hypothetical protein
MSQLEGKEVTFGVLQSGPIHVPSIGSVGATLDSVQSATNKAIKMVIVGDCIKATAKFNGKENSVLIPLVNFSHFVIKE